MAQVFIASSLCLVLVSLPIVKMALAYMLYHHNHSGPQLRWHRGTIYMTCVMTYSQQPIPRQCPIVTKRIGWACDTDFITFCLFGD